MTRLFYVALSIIVLFGGLPGCKTVDSLGQGISNVFDSAPDPPSERSQLVREVQSMLAEKGYEPGPIDGQEGPKTRAALRSFQHSQGLSVTSGVTEEAWLQLSSGKQVSSGQQAKRGNEDARECAKNFEKKGMWSYRTTANLGSVSAAQATQRLMRALGQKGFIVNSHDVSTGYVNATFDAGSSGIQLSAFIERSEGGMRTELNYVATGAGLGMLVVPSSGYRNDLCWFVDAMRGEGGL